MGILAVMQDHEQLPDDVPIADAVEQERPAVESALDDEEATGDPSPPLETSPADWQEQREIVELDPYEDLIDE